MLCDSSRSLWSVCHFSVRLVFTLLFLLLPNRASLESLESLESLLWSFYRIKRRAMEVALSSGMPSFRASLASLASLESLLWSFYRIKRRAMEVALSSGMPSFRASLASLASLESLLWSCRQVSANRVVPHHGGIPRIPRISWIRHSSLILPLPASQESSKNVNLFWSSWATGNGGNSFFCDAFVPSIPRIPGIPLCLVSCRVKKHPKHLRIPEMEFLYFARFRSKFDGCFRSEHP